MLPLFGAIPGGPELVIILFVLLMLFGPVVAAVVLLLNRSEGNDDDVAEMKARVDELEAQLAAEKADEDEGKVATGSASDTGDEEERAGDRDA